MRLSALRLLAWLWRRKDHLGNGQWNYATN